MKFYLISAVKLVILPVCYAKAVLQPASSAKMCQESTTSTTTVNAYWIVPTACMARRLTILVLTASLLVNYVMGIVQNNAILVNLTPPLIPQHTIIFPMPPPIVSRYVHTVNTPSIQHQPAKTATSTVQLVRALRPPALLVPTSTPSTLSIYIRTNA